MDRGYAFLALAKAAPRVPVDNMDEWVEQTLASAGLPSLKTIKTDATHAIEALSKDLVDGPLSEIRDKHRNSGLKIFAEYGPIFRFEDVLKSLTDGAIPIPPIILGQDFSIVSDGEIREWDTSPISKHIQTLLTVFNECTEFADACGI
jgi:hypothetical protein